MTYLYLYWCFGFFWAAEFAGRNLIQPIPKGYVLRPILELVIIFAISIPIITALTWPLIVYTAIRKDIQRL